MTLPTAGMSTPSDVFILMESSGRPLVAYATREEAQHVATALSSIRDTFDNEWKRIEETCRREDCKARHCERCLGLIVEAIQRVLRELHLLGVPSAGEMDLPHTEWHVVPVPWACHQLEVRDAKHSSTCASDGRERA